MTKYIFETNATDREWKRLRLIEQAIDAETITLLDCAELDIGARCLEIGAGAGSIVEWMAARVASSTTRSRGPTTPFVKCSLMPVSILLMG